MHVECFVKKKKYRLESDTFVTETASFLKGFGFNIKKRNGGLSRREIKTIWNSKEKIFQEKLTCSRFE